MAAITILTQTAVAAFRGGRDLVKEAGTNALVQIIRAAQAKVNEVINRFNAGTLDKIRVGTSTGYGAASSYIEMYSQTDGSLVRLQVTGTSPGPYTLDIANP